NVTDVGFLGFMHEYAAPPWRSQALKYRDRRLRPTNRRRGPVAIRHKGCRPKRLTQRFEIVASVRQNRLGINRMEGGAERQTSCAPGDHSEQRHVPQHQPLALIAASVPAWKRMRLDVQVQAMKELSAGGEFEEAGDRARHISVLDPAWI